MMNRDSACVDFVLRWRSCFLTRFLGLMRLRHATFFVLAAAAGLMLGSARAVILFQDGNPATNTTAPTGDLSGSGWQYQGSFGAFLGTAIAPQFFMTAKHVSDAGTVFVYNGTSYNLLQRFNDPYTDLS